MLMATPGAYGAGEAITATEGAPFSGSVATVTPACETSKIEGSPTGKIEWGDGQSSTATYKRVGTTEPNQYTVAGTNTYGEEIDTAGNVKTEYKCVGLGARSSNEPFTAKVADAPLGSSPTNVTATAGQPFSGQVASFTDGDPGGTVSDYSASINWGDGSPTSAGTATASSGGFAAAGSHVYGAAGGYSVTVTIADAGGSSATAHGTASVATPPAPKATFSVVSVGAGQAVFNASATSTTTGAVSRYAWNLTGGSQPDVVCPGSDPRLTVFTRGPLLHTVSLTAIDTHGAATVAVNTVNIPPPPSLHAPPIPRHSSSGLGTIVHPSFPLLGNCLGAPLPPEQNSGHSAGGTQPGPGGSPPPECDGQDVVFGAVDAQGCLYPVTDLLNEIHPADYKTIQNLLCAKSAFFCVPPPGGAGHGFLGFGAHAAATKVVGGGVLAYVELMTHNYISYSPVRIDGLDFTPENGAPIILVPGADLVVSSDATVRMDGFPISTVHAFALYLPDSGGHLGTFPGASNLPIIGSLPFLGEVGVDIHKAGSSLGNGDTCQYDCSSLTVHVSLPALFTDESGKGLSGDGVITADNPTGVNLDSLEVKVPHAEFADVGVEGVDFRYRRQNDEFHGEGTLNLGFAGVGGSIDFLHGKFNGASASVSGLNIPLGEGIFLTELDGGFMLQPTTITGGATVSGGPEVLGCTLVSIKAGFVLQVQPNFSFDLTGKGSVICQEIATAYFHVDDQGNLGLGGGVDIHVWFIEAKAGLAINIAGGHLQADAEADLCLDLTGGPYCLGGEFVLSDRGIGACADLGFTHAGGGIQFPDTFLFFGDSCDIAKFRSIGYMERVRTARAPAFTVPAGQRVAVIALVGHGSSPRATLRGPDGRTIDTPTNGFLKDPNEVVVRDDKTTVTTYFFINHPAPGAWTVTPDPGSSPITNLEQTAALPDPAVRASVQLASGGRARLRYSLRPIPGQSVTFAEQARSGALRMIGTTSAARGTITFRPSDALPRPRSILALVSQDGHPRTDIVVAHYNAPAPRPLPAPGSLKARRKGSSVVISWRRVAGAVTYALRARLSDGRRVFLVTSAAHPSLTIGEVASTVSGSFQVVASSDKELHHLGRRSQTRLRSGRPPRKITIAPVLF